MSLSLRQWSVLRAVATFPGISMHAIRQKTAIPFTTVRNSLMVLERGGLIRRVTVINGDCRRYECYLTDTGTGALSGQCR